METTDSFAKGMVNWGEKEDAQIQNYTRWQAELIKPFMGESILEIGAGSGRFTKLFHSDKKFKRYTAVEPSEHFYGILTKACPDVEAYNLPIEKLEVQLRNSYDTIVLIHVLEHIEHDVDFLKNASRLLIPGGKIIMMIPAFNWLMSEMDRNIGHFRRYDKGMMKQLAETLRYKIIINRYDNLIGVLGWLWVCKIRKIHYQSPDKKSALFKYFSFFDKHVLPSFSAVEKVIPPPFGLNLTTVLEKQTR